MCSVWLSVLFSIFLLSAFEFYRIVNTFYFLVIFLSAIKAIGQWKATPWAAIAEWGLGSMLRWSDSFWMTVFAANKQKKDKCRNCHLWLLKSRLLCSFSKPNCRERPSKEEDACALGNFHMCLMKSTRHQCEHPMPSCPLHPHCFSARVDLALGNFCGTCLEFSDLMECHCLGFKAILWCLPDQFLCAILYWCFPVFCSVSCFRCLYRNSGSGTVRTAC